MFAAGALAPVEIVLPMLGMIVRICGVTQWADQNHLVGVRFIHPSARMKNDLAGLLIGLVDKAAAELVKETVAASPVARSNGLVFSTCIAATPRRSEVQSPASEAPATLEKDKDGREEQEWRALREPPAGALPPEAPAHVPEPPAHAREARPLGPERRVQNAGNDNWNAVLEFLADGARLRGVLVDLSLVACIFRTPSPFSGGMDDRVEVEFQMRGLHFRLAGVTKGVYDKHTVGIGFLEMSQRRREELIQVLDELIELNKVQSGAAGR